MENCIFCKIANGEIPCIKIRENDEFIAMLDIFPNRKGMTVVIPKSHFSSDPTEVDQAVLQKWILAVQEVMNILKKGLWVPRVGMVTEGLEVAHLHFKLYPFWDNVSYPQGVGSGPRADDAELEQLAQQIISAQQN